MTRLRWRGILRCLGVPPSVVRDFARSGRTRGINPARLPMQDLETLVWMSSVVDRPRRRRP